MIIFSGWVKVYFGMIDVFIGSLFVINFDGLYLSVCDVWKFEEVFVFVEVDYDFVLVDCVLLLNVFICIVWVVSDCVMVVIEFGLFFVVVVDCVFCVIEEICCGFFF